MSNRRRSGVIPVVGPNLPSVYGPLTQELHSRAAVARQPINGTFELTVRCNLGCGFCYNKKLPGCGVSKGMELAPPQWLSIAEQAVDRGMLFLLLTGGEVFLYDRFFELYEPLSKMGIILTIFTNATLVTPELAARLAEAPPSKIEVTLYGATRETYETVTGSRGSFDRCIAGIEALLAHDLPLALKTTITKQNVAEHDAMRDLAAGWGLGIVSNHILSRRRDQLPSDVATSRLSVAEALALETENRRRDGLSVPDAAALAAALSAPAVTAAATVGPTADTPGAPRGLGRALPILASASPAKSGCGDGGGCSSGETGIRFLTESAAAAAGPTQGGGSCGSGGKDGSNFYCNAGKAVFVVGPDGAMSGCVDLPQPAAPTLEIGFDAAWEALQRFTDGAPGLSEQCASCDHRDWCNRCPAWSYLETGTLNGPVSYLCELHSARRKAFG